MFMMDAGARKVVWEEFDEFGLEFRETSPMRKHRGDRFIHKAAYAAGHVVGSDQAWISHILGRREAMWDRNDGVVSYTDEAFGRAKFGGPKRSGLQDWMRIVFFHGTGDPSQAKMQKRFPWIMDHWK
jgi:hypothetical protein